ncbi:lateral signaling target protein 2 homolog isoform X2 [Eriocheir sinensis]|uniref:lateral signaling target protein 2 homolog isoform X2 n=1 Tax=Eriocheir sinensis TaxID=95602 RepID=UPI0021C6D38B|nr:lateral signaling target protein 2 homolog isoform X2 [Eriocheir sinensis]
MEHGNSEGVDDSPARDAAALPVSSTLASPSQSVTRPQGDTPYPAPPRDFFDSFDYSGVFLHLGCDSSDMEEELRNTRKDREEDGFPSPMPRHKALSKFTLTPSLARKESERSEQSLTLVTPHHTPSLSVDCPERPSKLYRTSTSQYESSMSCRLLFTAGNPPSPVTLPEEENSSGHNHAHSPTVVSTKQDLQPLSQEGAGAPSSPPSTPIHSPSSCSDCVECSFSTSSSSPVTGCLYPFGSPILSWEGLTIQTSLSSPEVDRVQEPSRSEVLDLPAPAHDPQGTSDKLEERVVQNYRPHFTPEGPPEDAMKEGQAPKDAPLGNVEEMEVEEEARSAARKVNSDPMEASLAPSSTGSVRSNWTVISGISPLPSSEPSHHRHHHHGHHHHHHHVHHHHHRKHRDEDQGTDTMLTSTPIHQKRVVEAVDVSAEDQGTDNMLTSTPIHQKHVVKAVDVSTENQGTDNMLTSTPVHQKHVVNVMDVSAVTSSQDATSDPRFVLTSELIFPDSQSDGREEALEKGKQGGSSIMGSSKSDKENRDPGCAPTIIPLTPHSAMWLAPTEKETTKLKRPRQGTGEDDVFEPEGEKEMETSAVGDALRPRREIAETDLMRIPVWKKPRQQMQSWSYPQARRLTKAEAKALLAAEVNFSDDFLTKQLPPPHLSSTMDELLFRDVHRNPRLSTTLE